MAISENDFDTIRQLDEVYGNVRIRNLCDVPLPEVVERILKRQGAEARAATYSVYSRFQPALYQALEARLGLAEWDELAPLLRQADQDRRR